MTGSKALEKCVNIEDLRRLAKSKLPAPIFHFVDGGAEEEVTMRRNISAFDDYEIETEYAVDVSSIDTSTTVLGQKIDWPVMTAPTGTVGLVRAGGELDAVRAVAKSGTIYTLSCMANVTLEEAAAASDGPKMFQAYTFRDRGITREFLARMKDAGYEALCLTYDVPVIGMRERDQKTGMKMPPQFSLKELFQFAIRPEWVWRYLTGPKFSIGNVDRYMGGDSSDVSTVMKFVNSQFDPKATWKDAEGLIADWDGPVAIKGIMTAADTDRARDVGATAVIVSNHGGRQLDGAPAAVDRLQTVVEANDGAMEVILDGGIRRGQHVVKALGMGADACMIGRPYLYGMGAGGEAGVSRALTILREQFERSMALSGFVSVSDISRDRVTRRS
ncbi:MAG: alpha-hydroxy-acid oxidizing protein [Alphaproteobacteria bacterium]|nr:alpha-hydroxy-acid oxidizing protein [Alphaproteobacteria bacterium]MBT4018761.1 alpha-hydroxy-acid oxidizing protein [Alphaproteobacteria bacterium]MBT5162030.1 alpha-hydroxy-acid oxidizing protein [Alphaproteobacteria bacterium]MBT5918587.1 alpha-hydroxy-acid oxidizing protein [Alphaproteobacteria bacterium]MBT6384939.1 alpha-hydroxy-acid oxidizing protein [Alphaproteobacteria bacterium]